MCYRPQPSILYGECGLPTSHLWMCSPPTSHPLQSRKRAGRILFFPRKQNPEVAVTFLRSQGNREKGWGQVPCGGQYSLQVPWTGPGPARSHSNAGTGCLGSLSREAMVCLGVTPIHPGHSKWNCSAAPGVPWLDPLLGWQGGSRGAGPLISSILASSTWCWAGWRGKDNDTSCSLPFSPDSCRLGSPGLKDEHRQTLDRQTGTLFVPGLRHQFRENLENTHSTSPSTFPKLPWLWLGLTAQDLRASRVS